jgi:hypothetical protein
VEHSLLVVPENRTLSAFSFDRSPNFSESDCLVWLYFHVTSTVAAKKFGFLFIPAATSLVNCRTCGRRYFRNESLLHLPMSFIVSTGTLARYMAMAAPDRREWVPSRETGKPSRSGP